MNEGVVMGIWESGFHRPKVMRHATLAHVEQWRLRTLLSRDEKDRVMVVARGVQAESASEARSH